MRLWKFGLTLLSAALIGSPAWSQEVWNAGTFETSPANGDQASAGAGKIRDTRIEVRQRMDVEHNIGDADGDDDDNGLHRHGSARAFLQDSAPTVLKGVTDPDTQTLFPDYDNTGGTGEGDLDDPATNSASQAEDDVGDGRIWFDANDSNKL